MTTFYVRQDDTHCFFTIGSPPIITDAEKIKLEEDAIDNHWLVGEPTFNEFFVGFGISAPLNEIDKVKSYLNTKGHFWADANPLTLQSDWRTAKNVPRPN